jgi:hypothetical protein
MQELIRREETAGAVELVDNRDNRWFSSRGCYELLEMVNCWNEQKTLSE